MAGTRGLQLGNHPIWQQCMCRCEGHKLLLLLLLPVLP
jgi:hypothetical protein